MRECEAVMKTDTHTLLLRVRDPFLQVFEQTDFFWKKKVYCSRHIFSDFSEHQITEKGVQEISLKTVTLQKSEQLLKQVNFLGVVQKNGHEFFLGVFRIVFNLWSHAATLSTLVISSRLAGSA